MSKTARTTDFLKECMSDSLLKLMKSKEFSKITVEEITAGAGVNRSTWFRNYSTKNEALTFKLVQTWNRWAEDHGLQAYHKYTIENAKDFFQFNYENRSLLGRIWSADLQSVIYDAFYYIMMPQFGADAEECYRSRFYSYALFGLMDEWVKRDFREMPHEMTAIFQKLIKTYTE